MSASIIEFEKVKSNDEDLIEFAKMTINTVSYLDYKNVEEEFFRARSLSYVTNYWILNNREKIGVVKLSLFSFYDLGVVDDIDDEVIKAICKMILSKFKESFTGKIQGSIEHKFLPYFKELGWKEEYSRYRMKLNFKDAVNLQSWNDIRLVDYKSDYLFKLGSVFLDAYKNRIDERIGLITRESVHQSMEDIVSGHYGIFKPELSAIATNWWGTIQGASLITLSEGCTFLSIIGVRQKQQGKGLGRKLLSCSIMKCMDAGYDCMKLWVTKGNYSKIFYESLGFKTLSEIHSIYIRRN